MVVNFSKTKEMVMGPSSAISHLPLISVTSHQIERVTETKLLGIHLDCNLSWHPQQVEAITSKATQRLYFLKPKRAGVPHTQLLHFYNLHHSYTPGFGVRSPCMASSYYQDSG